MRAGARSHLWKRKVILTGVAASVAHVGGDEAPLVCGRVVKLHRGEVARAVVPSDHVQQPVDGAHACSKESNLCSTNPPHAITSAQEKKHNQIRAGVNTGPAFRRHMFMSHTSRQLLVCGSKTSTLFLTSGPSWPPAAYSRPPSTPTPAQETSSTVTSEHSHSSLQRCRAANLQLVAPLQRTGPRVRLFHQRNLNREIICISILILLHSRLSARSVFSE